MELRFIIDAETDGLYGPLLTVAILVTDQSGQEIASFYGGLPSNIASIKDVWVLENVLPVIGDYQPFETEEALFEEVWTWWDTYRQRAICFADVLFPVESNLFHKMVEYDRKKRTFQGPYPFIDISSLLYAKGIPPQVNRLELCPEFVGNLHNARDDVRLSAVLLNRLLNGEEDVLSRRTAFKQKSKRSAPLYRD
ncbi:MULTISPECIES: hypothetical protein [Streptococcus]|uniref:hypothetical protein n=1 Tax=Streptococcus TaxID=1301 RepID=UPI0015E705CF|nr:MULTISPECIES: hypothetical protein [unclassified Streptococcus]QTH48646.1 hypothetical protein J5M87_04820 [Streptococcus sp. zg-86]